MNSNLNISPFLDAGGKIKQIPVKRAKRMAVLVYLASKFLCNKDYTEEEVNIIIDEWHTFGDYCSLRRELIDNRLMYRTVNGTRYWIENDSD